LTGGWGYTIGLCSKWMYGEVSAPMDMPEVDGSKNIQHRKIRAELAENYWISKKPQLFVKTWGIHE